MKQPIFLGMALVIATCLGCGSQGAVHSTPQETPSALSAETAPAKVVITTRRKEEDLPRPVTLTLEDWPQYRGRNRDGISQETDLLSSGSAGGPLVLWETPVGQGYAAPSVVGRCVYFNDYDEGDSLWMVRCLALDSGVEQWRYEVEKRIRPNHAITRSAPATDGGYVIAIDPKCEIHCLDARDGTLIWKKALPVEYDSPIPAWYNGQCPLLEGDRVLIATGGRALIVALDIATGDPIWETENTEQFLLSHSSIMPVEIDGVKQYTYTTLKGLVGVDAATGKLLWHFPWKFNTAVSSTPLPLGDGRFFLTGGYHAQTVVCEVKRSGDDWVTSEVVSLPPPTAGWNSEVQTPILSGGHVYGIGKKQRGLWTCLDLEGNEVWTSEGEASFGMGGYVLADGKFFVLEGKTGVLRVLDARADHYEELANIKLLEGPDVWAPPIISHGKLLIRDLGKLICLDIAKADARVAALSRRHSVQPKISPRE
ncbi:outer membrane protein assembly factor BamB family protein [Bythopirellula polymerisocia]|uniref:Outer membrane protein assembly factor BamB n=1 Tax=Bythopirellula polymerisocia TaxID=2528003 RepID=A0A5C6CXW4_9BACT|nr:PQQ-binding-like beta-propeller repeat protein [Bythopirellula polymerisocia]TWU28387.1 Outer membrane protein assembly factor BamB [Bythopirellula polymerisocia]